MSDNLRDQIAATLSREIPGMLPIAANAVADVLIRELGLREHDNDKRLFKDGVWGCGQSDCKACY